MQIVVCLGLQKFTKAFQWIEFTLAVMWHETGLDLKE